MPIQRIYETSRCALDVYLAATVARNDLGAQKLLHERTVRSINEATVILCGKCAAQFLFIDGVVSDSAKALATCDDIAFEDTHIPNELRFSGKWPSAEL